MAGIEDLMGLGGFMQPEATPDGGWTAFLNDPIKRAGLLSFGLQAMTGGWGNGTQQLASALGAGASGMGATAGHLQETAEKNRAFTEKGEEGAANRASHEKIAGITSDSRTEVANIRAQASIDRAMITHPPQNNVEQKFYQESLKEVRKTIEGDLGSLKLSDDQREKLIRARALERLDEARNKGMFGGSATGVGAGAPSASTPAPTAPAGETPTATSGTPKGASWEQLRAMPGFDEKMRDPEWRKKLEQARPDLRSNLHYYDRETIAKDARKRLYGME